MAARPIASGQLVSHAAALLRLEELLDERGHLQEADVLEREGVEWMRLHEPVVSFLIADGRLTRSEERSEDWNEERRIEAILSAGDTTGHGDVLRAFLQDLTKGDRSRKPRTIRQYLAGAAGFLSRQDPDTNLVRLSRSLEWYMKQQRGSRANLAAFRSFLSARSGVEIVVPPKQQASVRMRDAELTRKVKRMRVRLGREPSEPERRALTAAVISAMYAVPLQVILRLTDQDVFLDRRRWTIQTDYGDFRLRGWLSEHLEAVRSQEPGYVFRGRGTGRSLTPAAVSHHVAKLS